MNADELIRKAQEYFVRLSKMKVDGVVGLSKVENGWNGWIVSLEALERRAIPDTMDVLGLYEVRMDNEGNLLGFNRKRLRKRGETEEE
jgi:hypothetical protein